MFVNVDVIIGNNGVVSVQCACKCRICKMHSHHVNCIVKEKVNKVYVLVCYVGVLLGNAEVISL